MRSTPSDRTTDRVPWRIWAIAVLVIATLVTFWAMNLLSTGTAAFYALVMGAFTLAAVLLHRRSARG